MKSALYGFAIGALLTALVMAWQGCLYRKQYIRTEGVVGVPAPTDTDEAYQLIVQRLPEVLPLIPQPGALATLRGIDLTYSSEDRFDADGDPIAGQTTMPRMVWVKVNEKYPDASKNALIHECVHVLLWRYYGWPDPNHSGPGGDWTPDIDLWIVHLMQEMARRHATP